MPVTRSKDVPLEPFDPFIGQRSKPSRRAATSAAAAVQPAVQPPPQLSGLPALPRGRRRARDASSDLDASETLDDPDQQAAQPSAAKRQRVALRTSPGAGETAASGASSARRAAAATTFERMRAATPPLERARILAALPENEPALYGEEIEIDCIQVDPPLPRKYRLTQLDGCDVELDRAFHDVNTTYLEFVTKPKSDVGEVLETTGAVVDFLEKIRQAAFRLGTLEVPIREVIPDCDPEIADRKFVLLSPVPIADIQTTTGVALADFDKLLEYHPNYDTANLERRTARVERALSEACDGQPVSEDLRGFIKVLLYYMDEAGQTEEQQQSVHGRFNFMLRSNFSSIYQYLLTPDERSMARRALLSAGDGADPLLLQAIGKTGDRPIFAQPYAADVADDGTWRKFDGPTINAFFESIVKGRPGSAKDLLSPPEGCPPTYGMGYMGVDDVNKKMFVEIRGHIGRSSTAANGLLLKQSRREYNFASRFNGEALGAHDSDVEDGADDDSWSAVSSKALEQVGRMFTVYARAKRHASFEAGMSEIGAMPMQEIAELQDFFADIDDPDYRPEVREALDEFADNVLGQSDVAADVERSFFKLMNVLWNSAEDESDDEEADED